MDVNNTVNQYSNTYSGSSRCQSQYFVNFISATLCNAYPKEEESPVSIKANVFSLVYGYLYTGQAVYTQSTSDQLLKC